MSKIVIAQVPADNMDMICQSAKKGSTRGAKVFGIPVSRELESYIEDVAPESAQQRIINMFFAGKFSPVNVDDDDYDDDTSEDGGR